MESIEDLLLQIAIVAFMLIFFGCFYKYFIYSSPKQNRQIVMTNYVAQSVVETEFHGSNEIFADEQQYDMTDIYDPETQCCTIEYDDYNSEPQCCIIEYDHYESEPKCCTTDYDHYDCISTDY